MRGGIALTDARLQTTRELQLLSDAETAQFAYLVTANPEYLSRYGQAVAALPEVQGSMASFFARQGVDGAKAAQRGAEFVHRILGRFDRTLALARTGDLAAATALAAGDSGRVEMLAVRTELATQLARAAVLRQQARTSIYDALLVNRIAVGSLTGVVLLSLFLFLRQLLVQDRERSAQQVALHEDRSRLEVEVQRRTVRLAELAKHLQTVREDERNHLARELHDELGGLLTVGKLELARARSKVGEPPEPLIRLGRLNENLDKGIALKRRIIEDLRPPALANQGLVAALRTLCADMATSLGVPVRLTTADFRLPPDAELTVYRFVQEALTNIGKYACAAQVEVVLRVADRLVSVEVRDDGVGFDPQASRVGHHGLSGMQFRAESLGGTMRVHSARGIGTVVTIEFAQAAGDEATA